jgi:hypothetical protein
VEPVDKVLRDVDWKTLLFITCMLIPGQYVTESQWVVYDRRKNFCTVKSVAFLKGLSDLDLVSAGNLQPRTKSL